MALIKGDTISEGELVNKWIYNRMIKQNKNILTATTGPTGSGKSYNDLRKIELWYRYHFNEEVPIENVCFSVGELMKRLSSGDLRKGEILILEEAGANLGSLDFQNKVSKLFTYVLQAFRSLNIGIFFNLPYLSMLNKQARMLIHVQFITAGINHKEGTANVKAYFRQINQDTGKVYTKHLRISRNGRSVPVKLFTYGMASEELCKKYEAKKLKFVSDMTKDFSAKLDQIDKENEYKQARKALSPRQEKIYELLCKGMKQNDIAKEVGCYASDVTNDKRKIIEKGFSIKKSLEK